MTSRKGDLIAFLVLSAASGLLILFYGAREVAGWESHRLVQAAAALWLAPAFVAVLRRKRGGGSLATNLQLALASCLLSALLLEAAFRALPDLFPENLRRLARDHQFTGADRLRVVEHLPYNPFEKLKADTTVHVPGYYGPSSHFAYEWSTDRRGFKNSPEIAAAERFDVVVLGDSFAEGMGVTTEDTFSSQLTDLGCPTYSLGVEGYAPYQFRGIYEHFARGLRPKLVLVGYLSGISQRETFFLRPEAEIASAGKLPSAIGRLVEEDELSEKHPIVLETAEGYRVPVVPDTRYEFAITALVALARHAAAFQRTFDIRGGVANPDSDVRFMTESALAKVEGVSLRPMARYVGELRSLASVDDVDAFGRSSLWQSTLRSLAAVAEMARADGAQVVFVFFPDRIESYYETALGTPLPTDSRGRVEARLLQEFAAANGIDFLDLTPAFQRYVASLTPADPIEVYPFLKVDGHPSRKGHELIARELARALRAGGHCATASRP